MDTDHIRFRSMESDIWYNTDKGASFCHVNKIKSAVNEIPCITSRTQKWNGDSPSFIVRAMVITVDAVGLKIFVMVHWPEYNRLIITAIISNIDVVTCVRKYLVDASRARELNFFIKMGIMASIFISKSIQINSQWELVITIMVPEIMVVRMMIKMMEFY